MNKVRTFRERRRIVGWFCVFWVGVSLSGCEGGELGSGVPALEVTPAAQSATAARFRGYQNPLPEQAEAFPAMLPSFRLPSERKTPGKADQYDDYRLGNPEWYAITIPPTEVSSVFRGMVEWEPMQALLLTASGNDLPEAVDHNLAEMTLGAVHTAGVDTYLIYSNTAHKSAVEDRLNALGITAAELSKVHWISMQHNSIWMIDYAPFPIRNTQGILAFVDFRYFHQRARDDSLPTLLGHDIFGADTFRMPIDFEGGNFQMDSQGTCYTTQGVLWFNTVPQAQVEQAFGKYLGCTQTVFLHPLVEEGTTHVDMFFKLVDDHTVILGAYTHTQDTENKELLDTNQQILEAVQLPDGLPITVFRMPMPSNGTCAKELNGSYQRANPPAACDATSQCPWGFTCYLRLDWRTYINSTFVKGQSGAVNLWPTYTVQPEIQVQAEAMWTAVMPGWSHQKVMSDTIITWNGAMHCISRTIPVGTFAPWVEAGDCANGICGPSSSLGYSGSCGVSTGCTGPAWLCNSNACDPSGGCGDIKYQGCCEGGKLFYCEDEQLKVVQCQNQQCGWDGQNGFYNCGSSEASPAAYPIDCPIASCVPDCAGKTCGDDGCGGDCGICAAGSLCAGGKCSCTPSCVGKECGDDGCGGICGVCGSGAVCVSGACEEEVGGCQGLSYQGCCEGGLLRWCEDDESKSLDCGAADNCGWDSVPGYYNCGFSGDGPAESPKACGISCTPDCAAKQCGGDGCGGSCGGCEADALCKDGACIPEVESCGGLSYEGCCEATLLNWCDNGAPKSYECGAEKGCGWNETYQYYACGYASPGPPEHPISCGAPCTPDCAAKVCGDDGCGSVCGLCQEGKGCMDGQCICSPDCSGRSCGDDGCGGGCGSCRATENCVEGVCVDAGGGCGEVGAEGKCVGSTLIKCGTGDKLLSSHCPECCDWSVATSSFECLQCPGCRPNCAGKKCGDDGCGGFCGACEAGEICQNNLCACVPDCRGKQCGDDGCRGSCGFCIGDLECAPAGVCVVSDDPALGVIGSGDEPGTTAHSGARETGSSDSGCDVGHRPRGLPAAGLLFLFWVILAVYRERCHPCDGR